MTRTAPSSPASRMAISTKAAAPTNQRIGAQAAATLAVLAFSAWATGDPPPRDGCSLDVLVDGAAAFPAIADAISNARDHVHITGWHVAPYFELVRGERLGVLGEWLAEAAERIDVRVLVWAGAPVPAAVSVSVMPVEPGARVLRLCYAVLLHREIISAKGYSPPAPV